MLNKRLSLMKPLPLCVAAIVLVVVIFFSSEGLIVSNEKIAFLISFTIILLFAFFVSGYLSKNLRENEKKIQGLLQKTRELSVTDGLTGLYNQAHFFLLLKLQLEKSKRYHSTFSLIIFDLDHFNLDWIATACGTGVARGCAANELYQQFETGGLGDPELREPAKGVTSQPQLRSLHDLGVLDSAVHGADRTSGGVG